jgi:hypothetical protein
LCEDVEDLVEVTVELPNRHVLLDLEGGVLVPFDKSIEEEKRVSQGRMLLDIDGQIIG